MESMIGYESQLVELRCKVDQYKNVIMLLQDIMAEKARCQSRYNQVQCLDTLRWRVEGEVHYIQRMETAASNGFVKGTLLAGAVEFTIASFVAWLCHSNEHPLSVGARWATSWETNKPFGTIVVAIGPGGLPDDVEVISLSRRAREQNTEEAVTIASLKSGYHVMSIDGLFNALEDIRGKVLEGRLTLPVSASYLKD